MPTVWDLRGTDRRTEHWRSSSTTQWVWSAPWLQETLLQKQTNVSKIAPAYHTQSVFVMQVIKYYSYVSVSLSGCHTQKPEEGNGSPETGVASGCEPSDKWTKVRFFGRTASTLYCRVFCPTTNFQFNNRLNENQQVRLLQCGEWKRKIWKQIIYNPHPGSMMWWSSDQKLKSCW